MTSIPYWLKRIYEVRPSVWGGLPHHDHTFNIKTSCPKRNFPKSFYCNCGAWLGCWGNEPTVTQFIQNTMEAVKEWHRVLHPSGLLFINIDDTIVNGRWSLIPEKLKVAMQEDEWLVVDKPIWHVTNKMPNKGRRFTHTYEEIPVFAKSTNYYFDPEANRVGGKWNGRLRNVWPVANSKKSKGHSAAYPASIPNYAIKAATSEYGVCAQCLAPYVRQVEKVDKGYKDRRKKSRHDDGVGGSNGDLSTNSTLSKDVQYITTGWDASCNCSCDEVVPATVYDPCVGTGTTLVEAVQNGRNGIGVDASNHYLVTEAMPRLAGIQKSGVQMRLYAGR